MCCCPETCLPQCAQVQASVRQNLIADGMAIELQQSVLIANKKLFRIYFGARLSVLILCLWNFFNAKKYTTNIPVSPLLVLKVPGTDFHDMLKYNMSTNPLCINPARGLTTRCITLCTNVSQYVDDGKICKYSTELYHAQNSQDGFLYLGQINKSFGTQSSGGLHAEVLVSPSIQRMSFEFSYTLDLLTDVPQFFSRNEPLKLGKGIPNSATTVVLDSKGGVWKRFEPRKDIRLSVPELLWLAEVDGGQDRLHAMI